MANYIRTAKEVIGESKGKRDIIKETRWWSEEVQEAMWEKRRFGRGLAIQN